VKGSGLSRNEINIHVDVGMEISLVWEEVNADACDIHRKQ